MGNICPPRAMHEYFRRVYSSVKAGTGNSDQVTIHAFAVYYRDKGKTQFFHFLAISDCLKQYNSRPLITGLTTFLKRSILDSLRKLFYYYEEASARNNNN